MQWQEFYTYYLLKKEASGFSGYPQPSMVSLQLQLHNSHVTDPLSELNMKLVQYSMIQLFDCKMALCRKVLIWNSFTNISFLLSNLSYTRLFSPCFGHCIRKVHENQEGLKFSGTRQTVPCDHINLPLSLFHSVPSSIGQDTIVIRPAFLPQTFKFILSWHRIIRRCCLNY